MAVDAERRTARRIPLAMPLTFRCAGQQGVIQQQTETRDFNMRGVYFWARTKLEAGRSVELKVTIPKQGPRADDVHLRCSGRIVRVDEYEGYQGVAAEIEGYEFLPTSADIAPTQG